MIVLVCTTAVGRSGHTHVVGEAAAAARAGNPFSPNNSSAEPKPGGKPSQIQPLTRYLTHTHKQLNFDDVGVCVCVYTDGKRHTDRSQLPQITQIIYWILLFCSFFLYAASPHSSRLVWYVMHFFTFFRHCSLFFTFFFCFCLFANFFLLCFSSFSRARVVFRLILSSSSCCCCCCWWCYGLSRTPHRDY